MKFLAWDIGIKNLAYNIIEYKHNHKDDPFQITEWNVINLIEEELKIPDEAVTFIKCCMTNKSGKACVQKAKYINTSDRYTGYCGKHQKEIKDKTIKMVQVKSKMNCIHNNAKTETECIKNGIWLNIKNPYIRCCQIHYKSLIKSNIELEKEYYMDPKHASKIKQFDIKEISIRLFKELEKHPSFLEVDNVILENQPHEKNPRMKSVQMLLYSWFVMKGIMTQKIGNIKCFSASKKLEGFTGNPEIAKKFEHIKSKYKQTKNTSVLFCKEMIKTHQKTWYDFICQHNKKDDLADTYLMNCRYIQNNHIKHLEKEEKNLQKKKLKEEKELEKALEKEKKIKNKNKNENKNENKNKKSLKKENKDKEDLLKII
jgi:hypothetical protein